MKLSIKLSCSLFIVCNLRNIYESNNSLFLAYSYIELSVLDLQKIKEKHKKALIIIGIMQWKNQVEQINLCLSLNFWYRKRRKLNKFQTHIKNDRLFMATIIICGKQQRQLGKCENIELVNYNGTKQRFTFYCQFQHEIWEWEQSGHLSSQNRLSVYNLSSN